MLIMTLCSCGIIGTLLSPLYQTMGFNYPFYLPLQTLLILFLGGIAFGVGAALNNGCNVGSVTRLTRGDTSMIITIAGWIIGELVWLYIAAQSEVLEAGVKTLARPVAIADDSFYWGVILIALPALYLLFKRREKRIWKYTTILGVIASALFIIEPHWAPSTFMYDTYRAFSSSYTLLDQRVYVFIALIAGMITQSIYNKTFQLQGFNFPTAVHHLFAGTLMGLGASMALGGNDSQMLLVLPNLTLASITPLAAMCIGIIFTISLRHLLITKKAQ